MSETPSYQETITKEALSQMPVVTFPGSIVVVDRPENVADAVATLRQAGRIGFDTETRPSFKKGVVFPAALLQLSTADVCYLFRLNMTGIPTDLKKLLEDDTITKIGLSVKDDYRAMRRLDATLEPAGFVEIQTLAHEHKIMESSLQKIYGIMFGARISKGQRLTNWEAPQLTPAQCGYAAIDAWACLRIYITLTDK